MVEDSVRIPWTHQVIEDDCYPDKHITRILPMESFIPTDITHAQMVQLLAKAPGDILDNLTIENVDIIHHMMGIDSEGGEIIDIAKKLFVYGKIPDRAHVVEELGDLEFYMEGLRVAMGITREETIEANMKKLLKRYSGYQYSDQAAIARADKNE